MAVRTRPSGRAARPKAPGPPTAVADSTHDGAAGWQHAARWRGARKAGGGQAPGGFVRGQPAPEENGRGWRWICAWGTVHRPNQGGPSAAECNFFKGLAAIFRLRRGVFFFYIDIGRHSDSDSILGRVGGGRMEVAFSTQKKNSCPRGWESLYLLNFNRVYANTVQMYRLNAIVENHNFSNLLVKICLF